MNYFPHPDLFEAEKFAYDPCGLKYTNLIQEPEGADYGACVFELNQKRIKFRTGKTTPIKVGQFVTLWKRLNGGLIQPLDLNDPIDFYVVSVRTRSRFGQFVFPRSVLYDKGILAKEGAGGKRAMRIYPPWDTTDNKQATNSQKWQLAYFFEIPLDRSIDCKHVRELFHAK